MQSNWVLLEDNSCDNGIAQIFTNPIEIICANNLNEISQAFSKIEIALKNNKYLVGFISYEFGLCFEEKTKAFVKQSNFPLIHFIVFDDPRKTKASAITKYLKQKNKGNGFYISNPKYSDNENQYFEKFTKIQKEIQNGDIYQANLTIKANYDFLGNPLALYEKLRQKQRVKYSAFFAMDDMQILSLSPELFFKTNGDKIETHPMKGTIKRGINNNIDEANYTDLLNDEKQRAENLMITDLMRNDLAKISLSGSVKVPNLFAIEKFETVFQMISKITSKLKKDINIGEILKNLAPAGSITGCPKIRAEEIIYQTENAARNLYCGAIGYIKPNGDCEFNVAIRTPIIKNNKIELGIGSGIVYDSVDANEYEECKLKAQFLNNIIDDFGLIETILWKKNDGFIFLNQHIERMKNSALFFGIEFPQKNLESELEKIAENIKNNKQWLAARIRILLDKNGAKIEFFELNSTQEIWKITISKTNMQSENPWLYHKTTNRKIYDDEWIDYNQQGFDEVIYCNENGYLTEGSRTNIFIDFGDGILCTPPIKCGVLNGILRQDLIDTGKAIEKMLRPQDFYAAQHIYVGNSLRGLKKASFIN